MYGKLNSGLGREKLYFVFLEMLSSAAREYADIQSLVN